MSAEPTDGAGVPISQVSRLLGVPMPTLRSWEIRYGIPTSDHQHGRHRRYSPAELQALRLMRDQVARGHRASAAAASVRGMLDIRGPAARFVQAFLAAANASDALSVRSALNQAERSLGLQSCLDEVVLPGMRRVGDWWQSGLCDMAQERLTTEVVRGWIDALVTHAPSPRQQPPIVLACGPMDMHTIGLEALTALLRYRRWNCRMLGGRTSTAALSTCLQASEASGVVLVSHLNSGRRRAVESLVEADRLGVPTFYAGNSFASARSRRGVPGLYLGQRLQDARAVIEHALGSHTPNGYGELKPV